MAHTLAALRRHLELMPSPVPDRPGLLIRDPFRYSESVLIVPGPLVPCLMFFDGEHSDDDLREALLGATEDVRVGELVEHLADVLGTGGFLDDEVFKHLRDERHRRFAETSVRLPAHAGGAYPETAAELRATLQGYLQAGQAAGAARSGERLIGIVAPHVSPEGGARSYGEAYRALGGGPERTFVVLGTSHYGAAEAFGLTRKAFATPLGEAQVDVALAEELARRGGPAVREEDYCHAIEHSIEFQVVFLQHLYGPDVRIVPVLCGPFAAATRGAGRPEDDAGVARFLGALAEVAGREGDRLQFVLGVDLAHIGRRYGDKTAAIADRGHMVEVAARDRARLQRIEAGDALGFWSELQRGGDPLSWCGASPIYTFLRSVRPSRGALLHYQQWNIDPESVVSFAAMAFFKEAA